MKWSRALMGLLYFMIAASVAVITVDAASFISSRFGGLSQRDDALLREVVERMALAQGVSTDSLYRIAAGALVRASGDPYAELMDPASYESFAIETGKGFGGIGVQLDIRGGRITIMEPHEKGPAGRAGILRGDVIVEINGESTEKWNSDQAVGALRGEVGEPLALRIWRNGEVLDKTFELVREEIHVPSIPLAYRTASEVGVVELRSFGRAANVELRGALEKLGADSLKGLILDMRGNPGGLLSEALWAADLFLDPGVVVAKTRLVTGEDERPYETSAPNAYPDLPIVILVDGESASASEILAGALQDHDRALVIGERTYGKGSVQSVFPLSRGHNLKMTTAKWFTPLGRAIDRERDEYGYVIPDTASLDSVERFRSRGGRVLLGGGGIVPDIIVPDTILPLRAEGITAIGLGGDWISTRDAMYDLARRHAFRHDLREDVVEVPPALLDSLQARMERADVEIDEGEWENLLPFLRFEMGREIARAEWGDMGTRRYEDALDAQMQIALEMLENTTGQQALLKEAESRYSTRPKLPKSLVSPHISSPR